MALKVPTQKEKDIFSVLNKGNGFINPLSQGSSALIGNLSQVGGLTTTLTTNLTHPQYGSILTNAGLSAALITSMTTSVSKGVETVSTLVDYGTKAVGEFSQRMRIADSYASISKRFTGVDPGCSAHSGVFGVVKSIGQTAMDTYHSVVSTANSLMSELNSAIQLGLNTVANLAQQVFTAINNAIAAATAFANKVVQAIQDELAEVARQIAASTNAWLASNLPDWFDDECKSDLTNSVASPQLKAAAKS